MRKLTPAEQFILADLSFGPRAYEHGEMDNTARGLKRPGLVGQYRFGAWFIREKGRVALSVRDRSPTGQDPKGLDRNDKSPSDARTQSLPSREGRNE
jgi:hypothetical protein